MYATKYLTTYILFTSVSILLFIQPDQLFEIIPISCTENSDSGRLLTKDFWPYWQAAVSGDGRVKENLVRKRVDRRQSINERNQYCCPYIFV